MPKTIALAVNSGSFPVTDNVTSVMPEIITMTTPTTTWWMCLDPMWILRGSHHRGGRPVLERRRINRTEVRVTKKVRMKAIRQHNRGNRPRPMMSCSNQCSTLEKLRLLRADHRPQHRLARPHRLSCHRHE